MAEERAFRDAGTMARFGRPYPYGISYSYNLLYQRFATGVIIMPISISLEFGDYEQMERNDRTRISLAFARLCWESIGPSAWRYPAAAPGTSPAEDWLNHVVPALMYLRCLTLGKGIPLVKYTLDAHSHSSFRGKQGGHHGTPILPADRVLLCPPEENAAAKQLSEPRMAKFLDDCVKCAVSRKHPEEAETV